MGRQVRVREKRDNRGKGVRRSQIRTFILIDCFYCRPDFLASGQKGSLSSFHTTRHLVITVIIIFPVCAFVLAWILCRSSTPSVIAGRPCTKKEVGTACRYPDTLSTRILSYSALLPSKSQVATVIFTCPGEEPLFLS